MSTFPLSTAYKNAKLIGTKNKNYYSDFLNYLYLDLLMQDKLALKIK